MDYVPAHLLKILRQKAIIHIYSVPNFLLEICIAVSMCCIYCVLHYEITKIAQKTEYKPHRLIYKKSLKVCASKDSFCTSVTHIRHQLNRLSSTTTQVKFKKYFNGGNTLMVSRNWESNDAKLLKNLIINDQRNVIDRFISMTPAQYVKLERERKLREKDLENCLKSLTTLYNNAIGNNVSQETIERQIQQAREELLFPQPVKYLGFDTGALTKSLFDLLEKIVTESSIEKPLPFKGDLTTLALDAGNLNNLDIYLPRDDDNKSDRDENDSLSSDLTACTTYTEKSSHVESSVKEGSKLTMV